MAILHINFDMNLERAVELLSRSDSPLIYGEKLPSLGNTYLKNIHSFNSRDFPERYLLAERSLYTGKNTIADNAGRSLQFNKKVNLHTFDISRFNERQILSAGQIVKYIVNNGISCYVMLRNLIPPGERLIGGTNPQTGDTIGDFNSSDGIPDFLELSHP